MVYHPRACSLLCFAPLRLRETYLDNSIVVVLIFARSREVLNKSVLDCTGDHCFITHQQTGNQFRRVIDLAKPDDTGPEAI